jgi:hypothetical protein
MLQEVWHVDWLLLEFIGIVGECVECKDNAIDTVSAQLVVEL